MYKGDLVRLKSGSDLTPHRVQCWRRMTSGEKQTWYASDEAKGMDDAGESKLPPQDVLITPNPDKFYVVVKARANAPMGYRHVAGCAQLLDTETGTIFYCERKNFQNAI